MANISRTLLHSPFSFRSRCGSGMDHSLRGFRGSRLSASMDEEDVKEADETLLNKALYSCAWKQENPLLTVVKNFPLSSKGFTAKQTEWLSNCITTRVRDAHTHARTHTPLSAFDYYDCVDVLVTSKTVTCVPLSKQSLQKESGKITFGRALTLLVILCLTQSSIGLSTKVDGSQSISSPHPLTRSTSPLIICNTFSN